MSVPGRSRPARAGLPAIAKGSPETHLLEKDAHAPQLAITRPTLNSAPPLEPLFWGCSCLCKTPRHDPDEQASSLLCDEEAEAQRGDKYPGLGLHPHLSPPGAGGLPTGPPVLPFSSVMALPAFLSFGKILGLVFSARLFVCELPGQGGVCLVYLFVKGSLACSRC